MSEQRTAEQLSAIAWARAVLWAWLMRNDEPPELDP